MNGVTFAISVAVRNATEFSIKLHSETQVSGRLGVNPQDMPRTPYRASVFIVLQCHLNDHLCRKVKKSNNLLLPLLGPT